MAFFSVHILSVQKSLHFVPNLRGLYMLDNEGSLALEPLIGGSRELAVGREYLEARSARRQQL